jgi:hypothetical protein
VSDARAAATDTKSAAKSKRSARTVGELIDRLGELESKPKQATVDAILAQFPKQAPLGTTLKDRLTLAAVLARLDPSWAARATLVITGRPENAKTSTATLGHVLATQAREVADYPTTDGQSVTQWAAWAASPESIVIDQMPWIGIAAVWPDRDQPWAAEAVGLVFEGGLLRLTRRSQNAPDVMLEELVDDRRRSAAVRGVRWLLQPWRESLTVSLEQADTAHRELNTEQRRAGRLEAELDAARSELDELRPYVAELEQSRDAARHEARQAEEARVRDLGQAHGRAAGEQSRITSTYGRELVQLAADADDYLDRTSPNVIAARSRIDDIRELAERLLREGT